MYVYIREGTCIHIYLVIYIWYVYMYMYAISSFEFIGALNRRTASIAIIV